MQFYTLLFLILAVAGVLFYIWHLMSDKSDSSHKPIFRSPLIIFLVCLAAAVALFVDLFHFFPRMMEPAPANTPTPTPTQPPSPSPTQPEELPIIDYADILRNSEEYSGKEVRIAGRISRLSDSYLEQQSIMFRDRLGDPYDEFKINLSSQLPSGASASDYYQENQYVIVQGKWIERSHKFSGIVISTGEDAKRADQAFMDAWRAEKYSYADTLPITNYMDIVISPEEYNNQRVRTIGQIHSVWTHTTWYGETYT